jgi:hypothetical protein
MEVTTERMKYVAERNMWRNERWYWARCEYVHVNRDGEQVAWGALSYGKNRTGRDLSEAGGAMWDVLSVPGAGKMVVVGCEMARRKPRYG